MVTKYINNKTSYLYEQPTGRSYHMVLIYGDEVTVDETSDDKRVPAEFRGKNGYLSRDHLGDKPVLEMYFIDVGQGDSTFIVTPNRKNILIDGGINKRAFGFLVWKYRLDKDGPDLDIDLLVLSHADADHIKGLIPIIKHPKIKVKKVIHNGIATFKKGTFATLLGNLDSNEEFLKTMHDSIDDLNGLALDDGFEAWREAISSENSEYNAVSSQTGFIDIGDPEITIEVLGPELDTYRGKPACRWFKDESHTINGHSVVLRLDCGKASALFTGDINSAASEILLEKPAIKNKLSAHIFKAPHHGSHDFYLPFYEQIRPQISVISSGDDPDHGHPRASCIGSLGKVSRSNEPLVFSTEIAATFHETAVKKPKEEMDLVALDTSSPDANFLGRLLFKRRLHGMINIRTNGQKIYAARRVAAGYWWESYGGLTPAP